MRRRNMWFVLSVGCGLLGLLLMTLSVQAQASNVRLIRLSDRVDLGWAPYISRVLRDAEVDGAAAVIIRIDTPGGRADTAIRIRDALLNSPVKTIAFVDKKALSAGALMALACDTIYMTSGSVIGAATPVSAQGSQMSEKTVSAIRTLFRATAERHGRPPQIAEAMVDADVAVPGLIEKDKLLTLTTQEAVQWQVADGQAETIDELLKTLNLPASGLDLTRMNWAEAVVQILTRSPIPALLLVVGLLALWFEFIEPGFGIGGLIGLVCLGLFFGSHHLVGLAGWEEALLIGGGLVLLALEFFVIPGFGVAGVLGVVALAAGLYLSLLGKFPAPAEVWGAGLSVGAVLLLVAIGMCTILLLFPHTPFWSRLGLRARLAQGPGEPVASDIVPLPYWLGATGTTVTPLMPSGAGVFLGKRLDIISEGEYIPVDTPVKIVHVEGHRIVVRADPPLLSKSS